MDFELDPDALAHIYELTDKMFEEDLGPRMQEQVRYETPIDTGGLIDSVYREVEDHKLYVGAVGDKDRPEDREAYAFYVETGYHQWAWGYPTDIIKAPQPFLRPALYRHYPGY
jgi:hypothetical protein